MEPTRYWIELVARIIETLAVAIMLIFILMGTAKWLFHSLQEIEGSYERYRILLGQTLLVGLELLVASDIINTIAFPLTVKNLALLGGLVLVRTVLGWTLTLEVEGHWPWQAAEESHRESANLLGYGVKASKARATET